MWRTCGNLSWRSVTAYAHLRPILPQLIYQLINRIAAWIDRPGAMPISALTSRKPEILLRLARPFHHKVFVGLLMATDEPMQSFLSPILYGQFPQLAVAGRVPPPFAGCTCMMDCAYRPGRNASRQSLLHPLGSPPRAAWLLRAVRGSRAVKRAGHR